MEKKVLAPELFQQLLEHSYYIVSEAHTKMAFFKQEDRRASSTLILLDLIKNWGAPATLQNFNGQKKGRPANNLLLLLSDSSWTQNIVTWEGAKYKAFLDWGSHGTHVSDLLVFRSNFFNKYSLQALDLCYDSIDKEIASLEYWTVISR